MGPMQETAAESEMSQASNSSLAKPTTTGNEMPAMCSTMEALRPGLLITIYEDDGEGGTTGHSRPREELPERLAVEQVAASGIATVAGAKWRQELDGRGRHGHFLEAPANQDVARAERFVGQGIDVFPEALGPTRIVKGAKETSTSLRQRKF